MKDATTTPPGKGRFGRRKRGASPTDLLAAFKTSSLATREREKAEKEEEEARYQKAAEPVISPLQLKLEKCLKKSTLNPVHIRITNRSYWYRSRAELGARQSMFMGVAQKEVSTGKRWFASIFQMDQITGQSMKVNANDEGARNTGYKFESKALRACEKAICARDRNPGEAKGLKNISPNQLLATHFAIEIVSQTFVGKSLAERTCLVADVLLDTFHSPCHSPQRLSGISYCGKNVAALPCWRNLGSLFADLELSLKTPQEWGPANCALSEADRFGETRGRPTSLLEHDWYSLSRKRDLQYLKNRLRDDEYPNMMDEERKELPKRFQHLEGGVYAHHLFGLPDQIRAHMLHELMCEEMASCELPSHQHQTMRSKPGNSSVQQRDHKSAALHRMEVNIRRMASVAIRVQRLWRRRHLRKAVFELHKSHRAATAIQRSLRGWYSRMYSSLFRKMMSQAAQIIQSHFRALMEYRLTKAYKILLVVAANRIQTIVRRRQAFQYVRWILSNYRAAKKIQQFLRGFLVRRKHFFRKLITLSKLRFLSACKIQSIVRGRQAQILKRRMLKNAVRNTIIIPAAMLLQRIWHGFKGKQKAQRARVAFIASIHLQRTWRGFIGRRRAEHVRNHQQQTRAATNISRVFRGFVEREIWRRRRQKWHHANIEIPQATKLQALYRGRLARVAVANRKQEWFAGLQIQLQFRGLMAKRSVQQKWKFLLDERKQKAACVIQMSFRGFSSRKLFKELYVAEVGKRVYAARVILRAWLRARDSAAFQVIKESWEIEKSAEILMNLGDERREILSDLKDIKADTRAQEALVVTWQNRLRALGKFKVEAELRISTVEYELDNLETEEIQQGWGGAYDMELEQLTNQLLLASEESHQLRIKIRRCQDRIQELQLEEEDVELDLDDVGVREIEEFELLRRMELERCEAKANKRRSEQVRKQRSKWAISDVRKNVIRRTRKDLDQYRERVKGYEPKELLTTLSFKKKRDWLKDEAELVKELEKKATKKNSRLLRVQGQNNTNIRDTYDAVLSGCMEVLQKSTFDLRRSKPDIRDDPVQVERLWGKAKRDE